MAVTLTRGQYIDIGDRPVWHRAGVVSRTLPGFSGTEDGGRPRTLDHSVQQEWRTGGGMKREMTEGTGERARVRPVNAGTTVTR